MLKVNFECSGNSKLYLLRELKKKFKALIAILSVNDRSESPANEQIELTTALRGRIIRL